VLKRVVAVVEWIAVAGFVVFVALLLLKQPESPKAASSAGNGSGAAIFDSQCARCHGANGEGGIGPKLDGGAVTRAFRTADEELVVVTYGRRGMPAFEKRLSPEQLRAVVDYTRTELQQR
jgi:mono/diheme cytochrome c family protein